MLNLIRFRDHNISKSGASCCTPQSPTANNAPSEARELLRRFDPGRVGFGIVDARGDCNLSADQGDPLFAGSRPRAAEGKP